MPITMEQQEEVQGITAGEALQSMLLQQEQFQEREFLWLGNCLSQLEQDKGRLLNGKHGKYATA